jgi:hypothetical protein
MFGYYFGIHTTNYSFQSCTPNRRVDLNTVFQDCHSLFVSCFGFLTHTQGTVMVTNYNEMQTTIKQMIVIIGSIWLDKHLHIPPPTPHVSL